MNKVIIPNYTIEYKQSFNYGLDIINVKKMWDKSIKGKGVNVAIIDSGCDIEHEELKDNIIGVYNFTTDDNKEVNMVTDYLGHGTHVAGIIGSCNKKYDIGVAPEANLLILKVINKKGIGNTADLINAIKYAINWRDPNNNRVDVINLSLGTTKDNPELREIINEAIKNNIVIVAAAGNNGDGQFETDEISYPGFYLDVFQIGATDENNVPTIFSNSNQFIDYVAPGNEVFSTYPLNQYASLSGTSMAAPHATGAIALIKNYYRTKDLEISNITIDGYLKQKSKFLSGYPIQFQGMGLIKL